MPLEIGKDIDLDKAEFPEVARAVVKEVNKLGEDTKSNYEALRKNYEELKKTVDDIHNGDKSAETEAKFQKLAEDITVRQTDLDKQAQDIDSKLNERLDQLEVSMQRMPKFNADGTETNALKEAKEFYIATLACKTKDEAGVTYERLKALDIDVKGFNEYKDAFQSYLRKRDEKLLTPEEFRALTVGSDPDGGYTVTPYMSSRIVERLFEMDPIRQLASQESITTGAIEFGVDWDEAGAEWEGETVVTTDQTTPKMQKKRIPVHILATRPQISQTLIEDSGINIERWLAKKVSDRFGRVEAASFVTGDGVGKPRGFMTYANGTEYGQIEQTAVGVAAVTADGYIDLKYSMIEQYLNRGTWVMNRSTVAATMKLKDGLGNYLWKPSFQRDEQATILSLPVRMSTTMAAIAAGALPVVLADWKESYLIVDRLGITVQRDPYTAKPFVEFYTRKRVGGDVINYQSIKIGSC
jgi:HK97 family phage major capsid protein